MSDPPTVSVRTQLRCPLPQFPSSEYTPALTPPTTTSLRCQAVPASPQQKATSTVVQPITTEVSSRTTAGVTPTASTLRTCTPTRYLSVSPGRTLPEGNSAGRISPLALRRVWSSESVAPLRSPYTPAWTFGSESTANLQAQLVQAKLGGSPPAQLRCSPARERDSGGEQDQSRSSPLRITTASSQASPPDVAGRSRATCRPYFPLPNTARISSQAAVCRVRSISGLGSATGPTVRGGDPCSVTPIRGVSPVATLASHRSDGPRSATVSSGSSERALSVSGCGSASLPPSLTCGPGGGRVAESSLALSAALSGGPTTLYPRTSSLQRASSTSALGAWTGAGRVCVGQPPTPQLAPRCREVSPSQRLSTPHLGHTTAGDEADANEPVVTFGSMQSEISFGPPTERQSRKDGKARCAGTEAVTTSGTPAFDDARCLSADSEPVAPETCSTPLRLPVAAHRKLLRMMSAPPFQCPPSLADLQAKKTIQNACAGAMDSPVSV